MHEAMSIATRALRVRDHSAASLAGRLDHRRVPASTAAETVALLTRVGVVDDLRTASDRAARLADRGYGDAWIVADLGERGYLAEAVEAAVEGLEAEAARIERVVERSGATARTLAQLARKGFSEDALEHLVAVVTEGEIA